MPTYYRKKKRFAPLTINTGIADNYNNFIAAGYRYLGAYSGSADYYHIYPSTSDMLTTPADYTTVYIEDYSDNSFMYNHPAGQYYKPGLQAGAIAVYMDQNNNWQNIGSTTCHRSANGACRLISFNVPAGTRVKQIGDYEFNENNTNNSYNYTLKFYVK